MAQSHVIIRLLGVMQYLTTPSGSDIFTLQVSCSQCCRLHEFTYRLSNCVPFRFPLRWIASSRSIETGRYASCDSSWQCYCVLNTQALRHSSWQCYCVLNTQVLRHSSWQCYCILNTQALRHSSWQCYCALNTQALRHSSWQCYCILNTQALRHSSWQCYCALNTQVLRHSSWQCYCALNTQALPYSIILVPPNQNGRHKPDNFVSPSPYLPLCRCVLQSYCRSPSTQLFIASWRWVTWLHVSTAKLSFCMVVES
jgi:hypothetical protein